MNNVAPLLIWKRFHWIFFVFIQGMSVCLLRFGKELESGNITQAGTELETAADLMVGAGASMVFAGNFSRQEYEEQVRQTMVQPNVNSNEFSGLMSYDHAYLVTLWKRYKPHFKTLPDSLQPQYNKFLSAYEFMASSHTAVCQKFGGGETGSLKSQKSLALNTLTKIIRSRWQLLNPTGHSVNGCSHPMQLCEQFIKIGFKSYVHLLSRVFNLPLEERS